MAKVIDLDDEPATELAPTKTATSTPERALAMPDSGDSLGISGEVSAKDLTIPYLSLVQKSGTKADMFPVGSWVVGENVVAEKDVPLRVVALDISKRYEEVTEFGSGAISRVFETSEEVRAAGLSLQRGAAKEAREIAGILFWITAPEGADPDVFPLVTETGTRGLIAKYVARSTGYSGVAMPIFTATSPLGHLRGKHIKKGQWDLTAALSKTNGNTYYKVSLRPRGATPADVLAEIDALGLV